MFLYNVTISIDEQIENEWIQWMKNIHIPEVLNTGCFIESRLSRVNGEEDGGLTYAITYLAPSEEMYLHYQKQFAPELQKKHTDKFSGKFAAFRTTLSVIHEFKVNG